MSGTWGSANIAGTRVSSGSADRAGTGGAASTSSGPRATADGRTSGVRRCWCSVGVAEPEGCARWPGSHALTSRNAADGVQHLWSLGLCADGMGLSWLGILALRALLGFMIEAIRDQAAHALFTHVAERHRRAVGLRLFIAN